MSWLCTSEKALKARPAELLEVAAEFFTNETQTEDAAQATIDLGVRGWAGFSGAMETGFGNLVEAIGTSMKWVAVAAGEAEEACKTAGRTLDELETESDALLITAETQLDELEALQAEAAEWDTKRYWRNQAVIHAKADRTEDPATYDTAVRRLHDADVALYWIGTAAELKRGELTASQVVFDRIREDEELAQSDLATALSPVHDTISAEELEFSADDLVGVGIVVNIFDLAHMSMTVNSKQEAQTQQSLIDARNAIAALVGMATTDELEALDAETLAEQIAEAIENGDTETAERLAKLLTEATTGMSESDFDELLSDLLLYLQNSDIGSGAMIALFATQDGPPPDWLTQWLSHSDDIWAWERWSDETKEMLAELHGLSPDDPALYDVVLQDLYTKIMTADGGIESLASAMNGPPGFRSGPANQAMVDYLLNNPDHWVDLVSGDLTDKQEVLEVLARGMTPETWEQLVLVFATSYPFEEQLGDRPVDDSEVFAELGREIGRLQGQMEAVGGGTYDFSGVANLALTEGIGLLPGGTQVNEGLQIADTLLGGYQSDDTYSKLESEERVTLNRQVLAFAARSQADPDFAEDAEAEMDAGRETLRRELRREPTQTEVFQDLMNGTNAIRTGVNTIVSSIEQGREDGIDGN